MSTPAVELDKLATQIRIPIDPEHKKFRSFSTFQEAKEYAERELAFWRPITGAGKITSNYNTLLNTVNQIVADGGTAQGRQAMNQNLARLQQQAFGFIPSDSPFAQFLAQLEGRGPGMVGAAINYYDGTWNASGGTIARSKDHLEGIIACIAFKHNAFGANIDARLQVLDQRASEVAALRDHLTGYYETLQQTAAEWQSKSQQADSEIERKTLELVEHGRTLALETAEEGKKLLTDTNVTWNATFGQTDAAAKTAMGAIEKAYDAQMKLKEPARYWADLEALYNRRGIRWMRAAAGTGLLFILVMLAVLYFPPLLFNETTATLRGFKGAVTLAAGISMFIYIINVFVKLSTSSYHLARDARERYQLTHVFLALIKDHAIDPSDRQLILSSLFSRADTGLLKGDAGPTIPTPGGTLVDALKAAAGK
jgi:hypothetical protein